MLEVQRKEPMTSKTRAPRIPYQSPNQLSIAGFESPFIKELDQSNRWIKLSDRIPWDELVSVYNNKMDGGQGRPPLSGRIVLGAMIIKHICNFSDRETIEHIQENVYMQYFLGYTGFSSRPPFDASLFVEIRNRLGMDGVNLLNTALARFSGVIEEKPESAENTGRVLYDATACPQSISYPTDLNLVSEARAISERLIDKLFERPIHDKKPRTYRRIARKEYLHLAQKRLKRRKVIHKVIAKQLRYLRRNLSSIDTLLDQGQLLSKLSGKDYKLLLVIGTLYHQQRYMHSERTRSIEDRIVNLHQPHVRPIVRGKAADNVEFGAKINVSLVNGFCFLDELSWDAFNEGTQLATYVEDYKARMGYYPKEVMADRIYCNRANRAYLKDRNIRLLAKPLGRPPKRPEKKSFSAGERNPIEGKFGQAKSAYGMNRIAAKLKDTSQTWIAMILFVTNLVKVARVTNYVQKVEATFSAAVRYLIIKAIKKNTAITQPWFFKYHFA